eukprot:CAMPEP_0168482242 /NCGR_PEP_ID=MMETSP0228-20121227/64932_1 /TAXON_ID=133427 /ORGANISM="Protoceratium reticulatum, Strain CCCM 535 (=CCMP 1889)" /LENGTH=72 /DNA_ID=CAMNT_0008498647 /DNA_START=43 /DNA_END=258 /DNA_ORIENTATION=+
MTAPPAQRPWRGGRVLAETIGAAALLALLPELLPAPASQQHGAVAFAGAVARRPVPQLAEASEHGHQFREAP